MEKDIYAAARAAQADLTKAYEALLAAVNKVVVAEVQAQRADWLAEFRAQQQHETYVRRRAEETMENKRQAALRRGDPDPGQPRRCTKCRRPEGTGPGKARFYQRKARPSSLCTDCEKQAKTRPAGHLSAVS